ncbi:hypothetical protein [Pyxidicoccus xibeiensis]|uniref:hypothetical protein n=1 Tax=Pyxidicoccus xibeiensis TaxID=2906759 RepID=UPI0020A73AFA|nr:hypothetical protein [Pyxidicoccus xibeiensis]MCP3140506.1 hypothetical protein [Pyxidicoccus xibeiensis]
MRHRLVTSVVRSVGLLSVVCTAFPLSADAQPQPCDDSVRAAYQRAVKAGASEAALEAQFGHCRTAQTAGLEAVITNFNVSYERMNSCGLHPQQRRAACDVEIRRNSGYGGAAGSFEHVRFCFDCDSNGVWDASVVGSVHVTDNAFPGMQAPPWYHSANAVSNAPPAVCPWGSGHAIRMRAILSWVAVPASCNSIPIWGNRIDFPARLDP